MIQQQQPTHAHVQQTRALVASSSSGDCTLPLPVGSSQYYSSGSVTLPLSDGPDHIHACTAAVASCGSSGSLCKITYTIVTKKKKKEVGCALDTGLPAIIAKLKEARRMPNTRRAHFALRVLDCRLGRRGGVHVLSLERARKVAPEPAALVRFLCVFWGHPLRRDGAAVFLHVEQRALLSCLVRRCEEV